MRASSLFLAFSTLLCTAAAAVYFAVMAADWIENRTALATEAALAKAGHHWVVVDIDGLLVRLSGVADSEAERFGAISAVGSGIDASRIIDVMEVVEARAPAPKFAVEVLRNGDAVSLIGLVPDAFDAGHVLTLLAGGGLEVTDLLESADFPIPPGFETATDFAARAALRLSRSKISVTASRVSVGAAVDDPIERQRVQSEIARMASDSFVLALDVRAPRPVVTPFALRFLRTGDDGHFDVCTADSDEARDVIRKAAVRAGLTGKAECTVGLGTPSPQWGRAVEAAIGALAEIGSGSVTFTDADVTLIAAEATDAETFDRVIGELHSALPEAFSLHAVLTPSSDQRAAGSEPPEFLATLSPEGYVQLRGRVANDLMKSAVEGFARARFGAENVYVATRTDDNLPNGWPLRVLAGLDALSHLNFGSVVVQPNILSLRGTTGNPEARAEVAKLLGDKLGTAADFSLMVNYTEMLDPIAQLPTPQECLERVQAVQTEAKISFEPGKATIDEGGLLIIDQLAAALTDCEEVAIEIGGHTDSQGRESMNLSLSQTRAEAVIDALLARRVLTGALVAKGYGEAVPIADNGTEEGREANRRIEFRLIPPEEIKAARRAALAEEDPEAEDEQN